MITRHDDFLVELRALCAKHKVHLHTTEDDGILVEPNASEDEAEVRLVAFSEWLRKASVDGYAYFRFNDYDGAMVCHKARLNEWRSMEPDLNSELRLP